MVAVIHHGPFESLRPEHTALLHWVEMNHYRIAGPYLELYINHNPDAPENSAAEIPYPVSKNG